MSLFLNTSEGMREISPNEEQVMGLYREWSRRDKPGFDVGKFDFSRDGYMEGWGMFNYHRAGLWRVDEQMYGDMGLCDGMIMKMRSRNGNVLPDSIERRLLEREMIGRMSTEEQKITAYEAYIREPLYVYSTTLVRVLAMDEARANDIGIVGQCAVVMFTTVRSKPR